MCYVGGCVCVRCVYIGSVDGLYILLYYNIGSAMGISVFYVDTHEFRAHVGADSAAGIFISSISARFHTASPLYLWAAIARQANYNIKKKTYSSICNVHI